MKSLMIVADYNRSDACARNPNRLRKYANLNGMSTNVIDYDSLMKGKIPKIKGGSLDVMLFFPYNFWDKNCEIPEDTGIYGVSNKAYLKFKNFFEDVDYMISKMSENIRVKNIIEPSRAYLDRDKIAINKILRDNRIPTTTEVERSLDSILDSLEYTNLFVKSRYGAEGKGITFLSKEEWKTNYLIDGSKLKNHEDGKWYFTDFTGNVDILKQLIDLEMIVEHEIVAPDLGDGKKFDVRVYSVFDSVPHMFIKRSPKENIITNYSQGGKVDHDFRNTFSENVVDSMKSVVLEAAKYLNSNFMGADVMFDRDLLNPKIIEIQNFPGYPSIDKFNLPKYLAERIAGDDDESTYSK